MSMLLFKRSFLKFYRTFKECLTSRKPADLARKPQETVVVKVGKQKATFNLYKETLCSRSPFFTAAFNGGFVESKTKEVVLEDVDSEVFGLFVIWLYLNYIYIPEQEAKAMSPEWTVQLHHRINLLIQGWVLGDYLQAVAFQNCCLKELRSLKDRLQISKACLPMSLFKSVYDQTTDGSSLQKWAVDFWTDSPYNICQFKDPAEEFHPKMLIDLLMAAEKKFKPFQLGKLENGNKTKLPVESGWESYYSNIRNPRI
jgi:hypothetical protein